MTITEKDTENISEKKITVLLGVLSESTLVVYVLVTVALSYYC